VDGRDLFESRGGEGCSSLDQDVCRAVALAALPESTACVGTCKDITAALLQVEQLFALNLADFVFEVLSLATLVTFYFRPKTGAAVLLLLLIIDIVLQVLVILTANHIGPAAGDVLDGECFDKLGSDDVSDALKGLVDDCDVIFRLGVIELVLAFIALCKDGHELFREFVGADEGVDDGRKCDMQMVLNAVFLFGMAALDAVLATIDFLFFTLDAQRGTEDFLRSIERRGSSWCITVSDECVEAAVSTGNSSMTTGSDRLGAGAIAGIVIGVVVPVIALVALATWWAIFRRKKPPPAEPEDSDSAEPEDSDLEKAKTAAEAEAAAKAAEAKAAKAKAKALQKKVKERKAAHGRMRGVELTAVTAA
jgi:hypothetical protein